MHQNMIRITITEDMTANAIQMRLMALSAGWHRSCTMIESTSVMTEQFVRLSMIGNASNTLVPAAKKEKKKKVRCQSIHLMDCYYEKKRKN